MKVLFGILMITLACCLPTAYGAGDKHHGEPVLKDRADSMSNHHSMQRVAEKVRYQLITLPRYGVFDWIEADIFPNDNVVLRGSVTDPTTKSAAEDRVGGLEGVAKVKNEIEVLPLLPDDNRIRIATYRAIFSYDGPLFQYALPAVPRIHILVDNGRVTLKGVVSKEMDRQLAYTAARSVPGVFDVKNELTVQG